MSGSVLDLSERIKIAQLLQSYSTVLLKLYLNSQKKSVFSKLVLEHLLLLGRHTVY
jgi:hypothetical protein